jgi:hypothetical protein
MSQKIVGLALAALFLIKVPLATAGEARDSSTRAKVSSTTKRTVWTIVGAGGGFVAGMLIGFQNFDDAVNSDRKIWTCALVGAAAGGVAGNLFSRNIGPTPGVANGPRSRPEAIAVPWRSIVPESRESGEGLGARVRALGAK